MNFNREVGNVLVSSKRGYVLEVFVGVLEAIGLNLYISLEKTSTVGEPNSFIKAFG